MQSLEDLSLGTVPAVLAWFLGPGGFPSSAFGGLGMADHGGEQLPKAAPGRAVAVGQFRHFGEAQLWVGKRQASLGLGGGRQQVIKLELVANLDSALLEQLELAVESPQADAQLGQDRRSGSGPGREETNQTMQSTSPLQGDVDRGPSFYVRVAGHDGAIPR
jgi:hypothetical protein